MRVTEYVGIQVLGKVGETDLVFGQRLTLLWTEILRKFPAEFDLVYAETIAFEKQEEKPTRRYAIEAVGVGFFLGKIPMEGFEVTPPTEDDFYSKYELPATEWWQIEH